MRKFAVDSVELDTLELQENEKELVVPAVITREDVFHYEGIGDVYLPKEELENIALTARHAWLVDDHPHEIVLVKVNDIRGEIRNERIIDNRVKVNFAFFKHRCSPRYLEDVKSGKVHSVSIGFFFDAVEKSGEFEGKHYDYVKKDMFIDHVAAGSFQGRCAYPYCGIGVNSVGLDPYPNDPASKGDKTSKHQESKESKESKVDKGKKQAAKPKEPPKSDEKLLEDSLKNSDDLIRKVKALVNQLQH